MMNSCLNIYNRLKNSKTQKQQNKILSQSESFEEFWSSFQYVFQKTRAYQYKLAFADPVTYSSNPVSPGVFDKIMKLMFSGELSNSDMLVAWSSFSVACTHEEWTEWYKPIVERKLEPIITSEQFFSRGRDIPKPPISEPIEFTKFDPKRELPPFLILEPFIDAPRGFIGIYEDEVEMFHPGSQWSLGEFSGLTGAGDLTHPFLIECYVDDGYIILRDIIPEEQYQSGDSDTTQARLERLTNLYEDHINNDHILMIDHSLVKTDSGQIPSWFKLFLSQGYAGMVVRNYQSACSEPGILIHPHRTTNLVVTDVTDTGKLVGTGKIGRKKITITVADGLTTWDRGDYVSRKREIIGQGFQIKSCGLDKNGELMFPVFEKWKG